MSEDFASSQGEQSAMPALPPNKLNGGGGGFVLSSLAYLDTAEMEILRPDTNEGTGWVIKLAGPGHPKAVKVSNELNRRGIRQRQAREEAQFSGRRWRPDPETPEGNTEENAKIFASRILDWHGLLDDEGNEIPFSEETARTVLANERYRWVYTQISRFVLDEVGFLPASAKR